MTSFPELRPEAIFAFKALAGLAREAFPFDEQRTLMKQMAPVRMGKTLNMGVDFGRPRLRLNEPNRKTKGRTGARKRIADRKAWKAGLR